MSDAQLLTLALAIILPLSMLIYSNSRITEAKETLRADIRTVQAEMKTMSAEVAAGFVRVHADIDALRSDIRAHVLEYHK